MAADLVATLSNPRHRRSPLITLTEQGRAAMATTSAREHARLRDVRGDLTAADIDTCLRVLRHLREPFAKVDLNDDMVGGDTVHSSTAGTDRD